MGKLTTHILDTANGTPAKGMRLRLFRIASGGAETLLLATKTNADGRVDAPLLADKDFKAGTYRIEFEAGKYFRRLGGELPKFPFFDVIQIHFGISDADSHYHVPLLVSPYGYSTYRGS